MMLTALRVFTSRFKSLLLVAVLAACSVNPATGEKQFAALMSPSQELKVGADEHAKVMEIYGVPEGTEALQVYISRIGASVAKNTERPDVQYKFFLLDDPMVNAFALPGGYVYVTRGLLAQANSEAELAAVLGHEVGHVTGRHSAERYSQGMLTNLGAMVLSAALDSQAATQAIGIGGDLFLKSYSRGQENEADMLGIRYLSRAGYDPRAMSSFLASLDAYTKLESRLNGQGSSDGVDWFSTHPLTADRIAQTVAIAAQYPAEGAIAREQYLKMIDGLVYGDSPKQGFVRDNHFYHTQMDFTFAAPEGFTLINQANQVAATDKKGTVILFDAVGNAQNADPLAYMKQVWLKGEAPPDAESIDINGMRAATASFPGTVDGRPVTIRIVAVAWNAGTMFRFQMAIPQGAPASLVEDLKRTTYSLRRLTDAEKRDIQPYRLRVITAKAGDTVATLAARMPFGTYHEERFRALNAMGPGAQVVAGQPYKVVGSR